GVVLVRPLAPPDAPAILAQLHDPTIRRWAPIFTRPCLAEVQDRIAVAHEQLNQGDPRFFVITWSSDPQRVLGTIECRNDFPIAEFSIRDLGYAVSAPARRRGLGSAALRLLSQWLLDPRGGQIHRVQLDHAVGNLPSCRTAERAGLPVEGRRAGYLPLRESAEAPLVYHDVCLHGRTRGEPGRE
ncbi:MAG: GNAT family N-acetyltransferase, partial [Angustibacter sp.]